MLDDPKRYEQPNLKLTEELADRIIDRLVEFGGNITKAMKGTGLSLTTMYNARTKHPDFDERVKEAIHKGVQSLEDEAIRRARDGVKESVYYLGEEIGVKQRYSDGLLMFLLKSKKPDVYGDKSAIDLNSRGNIKIEWADDEEQDEDEDFMK